MGILSDDIQELVQIILTKRLRKVQQIADHAIILLMSHSNVTMSILIQDKLVSLRKNLLWHNGFKTLFEVLNL